MANTNFIIHTSMVGLDGFIKKPIYGDVETAAVHGPRLWEGEGREFQLFDDDGELYYKGRILVEGHDPKDDDLGEEYFRPLEWAESYAGCTSIQYLIDGKWETL